MRTMLCSCCRLKASSSPKPFTAPLAHGPSREMNCSDASVPPLHRVASCSQRQNLMLPAPGAASTGGLGRCFAADEEASYDAVIGPGRCLQQTMKRPTMQSWLRHSDFDTLPRLPPLCSGRGQGRRRPLPQKQFEETVSSARVRRYPEILILNLFAGPLSLFKGHYDPRRDGMRLAPHAPHHCFQRWSW